MAEQTKTETKKRTRTSSSQNKDNLNSMELLREENERLKEQISEQASKFEQELNHLKELILFSQKTNQDQNNNYGTIRPDKYIKVMSLTHGLLNLNAGNGKVIHIDKYGDVKNILYGDLINIINNHYRLASQGGFYIFDEQAVEVTGLGDSYSHILNDAGINALLDKSADELEKILNELTDYQKETVATCIVDKICEGKDVGALLLNVIDKCCNTHIMDRVHDRLYFEDEIRELEKR